MYNPNFDDKRFRESLRTLKLQEMVADRFVTAVRLRIASEDQRFNDGFYNVKATVNKIRDKRGISDENALRALFENPTLLFTMNNLEVASSYAEKKPEATHAEVSPFLRLQASRGTRRRTEGPATLSKSTLDMLAVPANDRLDSSRVRGNAAAEEALDAQQQPVERAPKRGVRFGRVPAKYTPTHREIVDAARAYKEKHGKLPYGDSTSEFLPPNSLQWNTLVNTHLTGLNSLHNLMERLPPLDENGNPVVAKKAEKPAAPPVAQSFARSARPEPVAKPVKSSHAKSVPTDEEIAEAAWKYEAKHGTSPRYASGREFLPEGSPSWSTLNIHHLKRGHTLKDILKAHPKENFKEALSGSGKTPHNGHAKTLEAAKSDIVVSPPAPVLKKAFNPVGKFYIQTSVEELEKDLANFSAGKLALLAASRMHVTGNPVDRANLIYQSAIRQVMDRMFGDKAISEETFIARQQEFNGNLHKKMMDIVMGRETIPLRGLQPPKQEFLTPALA